MKTKKKGDSGATGATTDTPHTDDSTSVTDQRQSQQLTPDAKKEEFEKCEEVIKNGLAAPIEIGRALRTIRELELYKIRAANEKKFTTFQKYCLKRWDMCDKYAYRLIEYADIIDVLKSLFSTNGELSVLPENEAQARPLTRFKGDKRALEKAWKKVVRKVEAGQRITAAMVEEAVEKVMPVSSEKESDDSDSESAAIGDNSNAPLVAATEVPISKVRPVIQWIDEALAKEGSVEAFQLLLEKIRQTLQAAFNAT